MSKEVLKLSSPIKVNGNLINELTYDLNALGPGDILMADRNKTKFLGGADTNQKVVEFDTSMHICVGMQAIIKLNPSVDVSDLNNLSGFDTVQLMQIGRRYFTKGFSVEKSAISEEPSATIQEDTTAQS